MEYLTDDYYRRRTRSVVTQINQVNRLSAYVIDSDEETGQPRIVPRSPPRPIEILSDSEHPSSNSPQNRPARLLVCRDDSSTEMSLSVGTSSQSDCTDIEELTPRRSATKNQEVHQILATLTSLSSSTIYPKYLSDRFQSLQTFQNLFPIYHTLHLTPQSTTACPADCLLRQFPLLASNQYQLIHRVWHCGLPSYLELGADWEWAWRYIIRGTRQKKEMITTEACRIQQLLQAKGQLDCDEIEAYQTAWMKKYQPNVDLMNNERTVYNLHQQRLQDEEEDRIDFIFPRRNNSRPKKRCFRLERCHTKHSSEIGAKQGLRFEHELDNRFRRPKLQFSEDFRESPMSSIHPSESALGMQKSIISQEPEEMLTLFDSFQLQDSPPSEDAPPIQKPPHPPSQKEEHSETDLFETQISQNEQKFQVQPVKSLFSSVSASDQPSFHESQQSSQPLLPSALLENHQRSETPLTLLQNRFGVQFEETFAGLPETPEYDSMVRPNEEIGKEDESASDEQLSDIIISLSETPQNPEHHSIAHVSLHDSQTQLSSQPSPPSLETFTPSDNIIITSEQQPLPPSNSFGTLSLTAHSEDLQTQPVVPETNFIVDERSLSQLEYASQDSGNPSPEQLVPTQPPSEPATSQPVVPSASVHIPFNHIQQSFGETHAELLRDICEWDPNSEQIVEVTMPDRTPLNNPSDGADATHIVQRTSSDPIVENGGFIPTPQSEPSQQIVTPSLGWSGSESTGKEDPTQQNEANFEKSVGLPLSIPTSVEFVERISEWLAREDAKAKSELARTVDDILITPTEEEPPNSLLQIPLLSSFFPALPPKPTPPDYTPLSSLQISPNVSVIAIISDFTLPRPPINKSHPPSKPRGHGAPPPNGGDWHVKLSLVDETLPVNMNGLVTPITANLFFSWNQMRDPACPCHNLRVGAVVWLKSITVQKYQGRPQIKGSSGFFSMEIFSRTDEQLLKVVFDSKKTLDVGVEEEQARKEDKQEIIDCDADTPKIILSRRRKGKKGAKRFAWRKKTDGKAEPDSPSPSKTVRDVPTETVESQMSVFDFSPREEEEDEEIMLKDADENEKTVTRSNPTEDPDTWDESQRISSPKPPPNQPPTPSSPTEHFSPPPFALVSPPTFLRRQHNPFIPTPLHSTPIRSPNRAYTSDTLIHSLADAIKPKCRIPVQKDAEMVAFYFLMSHLNPIPANTSKSNISPLMMSKEHIRTRRARGIYNPAVANVDVSGFVVGVDEMGVFVFDPLSLFGMDLVYVQIIKKNQERMEENDITERLLPSLVRVGDFVRFGSLTIRGADIDQSLTSSQQSLSLTPSFATSSVSQSPPLTQSARQLIVSTYHSLGATHLTVQHHHAIADRFPVTATFSENDSKLFVVDFASAVGRFNVEVKDVVRIEQTWQRDQLRDVVILPKIGEWGDHPLNENGQTSTQLTPTKTDDRDETPPHVKKKLKMLLNRTKTKEKEMPRKEDKQDNKEKPELEEAEALPPSHPPSTDHFRTPTPAQHNTPQSAIPRPKIVRRASGRTKKRTMPTQNSTTPPSRRESQEETEAGSAAVQFVHPPHFVNSSSTQSDTSSPAGSQPTSLEHRKCILLLYWLHSTLGEQFYQYTPSILHLAVAQQQLQRTPSEQAETQTMPTISAFCAVLPEWVKTSLEMMKVVLEEDSLIPLPFHSYSHLETKAILSDFQTNRQTIVFTFPTPIQYTPLHLLSSPTFAHSPTDPRTRHRVSLLSHYPSSLKQFTRQNEDGLVICEIVLEVEDVFVPLTRPFVPSTLSVLVQSDQQVDVHPIHPFHHMSSRPLLLFPFAPKHFDGVAAWNTINDTITTLLGNENKRPAFDVILTPLDEERDVGGHCVRFAVVDTTVLHVGLEARS